MLCQRVNGMSVIPAKPKLLWSLEQCCVTESHIAIDSLNSSTTKRYRNASNQDMVRKRSGDISADPSHPAHNLFKRLPAGRRYRAVYTKSIINTDSFILRSLSDELLPVTEHEENLFASNSLLLIHTPYNCTNQLLHCIGHRLLF